MAGREIKVVTIILPTRKSSSKRYDLILSISTWAASTGMEALRSPRPASPTRLLSFYPGHRGDRAIEAVKSRRQDYVLKTA